MCFAVSPSLRLEVDWNSQTYNSEICIWLTKVWQENFKSTVTEYSQYFHRGDISSSQRRIQEVKPSPNSYPVLNYCCKEPFFMLNYWKAYDEIILITSRACQVILPFRRYEICRQHWCEGSPGETSVYCWHNCITSGTFTAVLDCRLCAVNHFIEWCISYSATASKWFLGTIWDVVFVLRQPHAQPIAEVA